MSDLRYPIGKFAVKEATPAQRAEFIEAIASAPALLRKAVAGLSDEQLDTPYREGGWTVRQVVHHIPDSHMHSYARFRYGLTEDAPAIKAYPEEKWAELADAKSAPVGLSLALLAALHARWVVLLRSMSDTEFTRGFVHPEMGLVTLEKNVQLYGWHGRHHIAQITGLRERKGW